MFSFHPDIWLDDPIWLAHIFQMGGSTTNRYSRWLLNQWFIGGFGGLGFKFSILGEPLLNRIFLLQKIQKYTERVFNYQIITRCSKTKKEPNNQPLFERVYFGYWLNLATKYTFE